MIKPATSQDRGMILCGVYIVGLVASWFFDFPLGDPSWVQWLQAGGSVGLAVVVARSLIQKQRFGLTWKFWVGVALVGLLALGYFQWRSPRPPAQDISGLLVGENGGERFQPMAIQGKILTEPRLNSSQKVRFYLRVQGQKSLDRETLQRSTSPVEILGDHPHLPPDWQPMAGKTYVTVPLLQGTGLFSGETIRLVGSLYAPSAAVNPGGFDFKSYLARDRAYSGFSGKRVTARQSPRKFSLAQGRQRVIRSIVKPLGSPLGELVSSMVLGRRAVDLPAPVQLLFQQGGLPHVLAASGFHVSLLLGVVLWIMGDRSEKAKLWVGTGSLIFYLGLTGLQPSLLRASLMGFGGLVGLALERKTQPLNGLLLAATLILLFNPLWIWDLGFQLSFLATLGLLLTLPALQRFFDFLPPTLASLGAIPLAATLWTLPLIIYQFNVISTYGLVINVLATPLVLVVSLGGMVSGFLGLLWPPLGSAIAWCLWLPTQGLFSLVETLTALPGSYWAVGKIHLGQMALMYGGIVAMHWVPRLKRRSPWVILFLAVVLILPGGITRWQLHQVTVLANAGQTVVVIQQQGKITLINSGDRNGVKYGVVPFLRQLGVNRIHRAIALELDPDTLPPWQDLQAQIPIDTFWYGQKPDGPLTRDDLPAKKLKPLAAITQAHESFTVGDRSVKITIRDHSWLIKDNFPKDQSVIHPSDILVTGSRQIPPPSLEIPPTVILTASYVSPEVREHWERSAQTLYDVESDNAIQWTVRQGFIPMGMDSDF